MTAKSALQKILKGNLYTENENKHNHERMGIITSQENSIEFIPHTQSLTQQKRLNERDHHIPFNINNEC
jgi:hypothetical protein